MQKTFKPASGARFPEGSPVNSGQQIRKLRRRDCHRAALYIRPDKPAAFQFFREQACALAIMPDQFYQITSAAPEAEQMYASEEGRLAEK